MHNTLYIADIRSNVCQGQSTGHFVPVARMYRELFEDTCQVIVSGGPIYKQYFDNEDLYVLPYNISSTTFADKWHCMQNAISLFRKAKGQIIILQHSSIVTCIIAIIFFYWKTSKLYLIQYSTAGINSPFKRLLYSLCKWKIDGLICPNKKVAEAFGLPACIIPDYIYTDANEHPHPEYKNKVYDFCMVGRIAPEKGIVEAAQYFAKKNYRILIAGNPQDKVIREELLEICRRSDNITLQLGYISDEEYLQALDSSKYAILNYKEEYAERSSGVVFDTLFNNVPVIGRRCPALQMLEKYGCGMLYHNISDFEPQTVLSESRYNKFLKGIVRYRKEHLTHKDRLLHFILH